MIEGQDHHAQIVGQISLEVDETSKFSWIETYVDAKYVGKVTQKGLGKSMRDEG